MRFLKTKQPPWLTYVTAGKPLRFYIFFFIILLLLFLLYLTFLKPNGSSSKQNQKVYYQRFQAPKVRPFTGAKIVHIDLKGAPLKISYYKHLFPLLAEMGATGVLIEYEDMFPYDTRLLKNVSALNAYSLDDIKLLNRLAKESQLEIIPLIQTFGHLEFLLKLEQYQDLREVPESPQVICPTHEKAINLIVEMVVQVIDAHPTSKHVHIGADEVYYLGFCDRCANILSKMNLTKNAFFTKHINSITNRIHSKYPTLNILMWDDEFRTFSQKDLNAVNHFIQPVVWKYTRDVYEHLGPSLWQNYANKFRAVWAASAFKGATGSNQYVSDVSYYVQNHRSWRSLIMEYEDRVKFAGIIITGWQRYDHFAVLCELLPVALPSLAMSLRVILGFDNSPLSPPTEVAKILKCEQPYALMGATFGTPRCSYIGAEILEGVLKLQQLRQDYESLLEDSRVKGWMSEYNKKHVFSSPYQVESVTASLSKMKVDLDEVDFEIGVAMFDVYDNYTITEFKDTYIGPFQREVNEMLNARNKFLRKKVWPRRPLLDSDF